MGIKIEGKYFEQTTEKVNKEENYIEDYNKININENNKIE